MTIDETRQLGIEFERRVQQMQPEREFLDKLDTETIYSYLNQFQDKYIKDIYRSLDQIAPGTNVSANIETIVSGLLKTDTVDNPTEGMFGEYSLEFVMPEDFYMYIKSTSVASETYSHKGSNVILSNDLFTQNEVAKLTSPSHDSLRVLRNPVVILSTIKNDRQTVTLVHDRYTKISALNIIYYKVPNHFDILTNTPCELSINVFDDLVSGAIELYLEHASLAAKEAAVKQRQAAAQKNAQNESKQEGEQ